ncbi:hypothetical protein Tco_0060325 [Tanacetum coccineum]
MDIVAERAARKAAKSEVQSSLKPSPVAGDVKPVNMVQPSTLERVFSSPSKEYVKPVKPVNSPYMCRRIDVTARCKRVEFVLDESLTVLKDINDRKVSTATAATTTVVNRKVDPAQALNVPIVPLGAMLTAVYSLTSRPPYSLAWLNHMISTQDIMDPDLLKKLVLKNFCTIPAKLLLQLASAFKERGLSDRSGTFFYQEHIHKINVPILVVASDQERCNNAPELYQGMYYNHNPLIHYDAVLPLEACTEIWTALNIDDDLQTHFISVTFTGYGSYWNGRWRLKYISYLNRIWLLLVGRRRLKYISYLNIILASIRWKVGG